MIFDWLNELPTAARIKAKRFGIAEYKRVGGSMKFLTSSSMYTALASLGLMTTPQKDYWNRIRIAYELKSHPKNEAAV